MEHHLHSTQDGKPSFFHVNNRDCAEIDYVLQNKAASDILILYETHDRHAVNLSDHVPVSASIAIQTTTSTRPTVIHPKPNWDRCFKPVYKYSVANNLETINQPIHVTNTLDFDLLTN